jgi:hypothetical protein
VTPAELRDALLARAVDVVDRAGRSGDGPTTVGADLLAAWRALAAEGPDPVGLLTDDGFQPDVATGVEALAFLVAPGTGGVVLRLPGELPDSFEALDVGPAVRSAAGVRHAWFGSRRPGGHR